MSCVVWKFKMDKVLDVLKAIDPDLKHIKLDKKHANAFPELLRVLKCHAQCTDYMIQFFKETLVSNCTCKGCNKGLFKPVPLPPETKIAPQRQAASRIGSSHMERPNCCSKPGMAQQWTSSTQEGSHRLPLPTRIPSTKSSTPSSSLRSAFAGTSAATLSSTKRPRSTPPSSRPSESTGEGWSLWPSLSVTRVPH